VNSVLEYKGYHTRVEYDAESETLHGKIEGINDYVDFVADDVSKVKEEFRKAVDDYLAFCAEVGKNPEKEYKGSFNVRIDPELHRRLAVEAVVRGESLNSLVAVSIEEHLEKAQSVV